MQRIISLVKTFTFNISTTKATSMVPTFQDAITNKMLIPYITMYNSTCGLKVKGRVKRRCKSCYIVVRDERMYVMCPKFPRHKQMSMKPKPHNTWTLTHASQSPVRPW